MSPAVAFWKKQPPVKCTWLDSKLDPAVLVTACKLVLWPWCGADGTDCNHLKDLLF